MMPSDDVLHSKIQLNRIFIDAPFSTVRPTNHFCFEWKMFPKIEIIYSLLFRYKNFETGRFFLYLIPPPPPTTTTQHNNPIIICHNGIRVIWLFYFLETEKNSIFLQIFFLHILFPFTHSNRKVECTIFFFECLRLYLNDPSWNFFFFF